MISPEDKPSHALFIDKYGHHYIRYTYLKFSQLHLLNMILKNAFLNIINDYFDEYTFDQPDSVYIYIARAYNQIGYTTCNVCNEWKLSCSTP